MTTIEGQRTQERKTPLKPIERAKEYLFHSNLLTPLPTSPSGFHLSLKNNIPSQLTPQEKDAAAERIAIIQQKPALRNTFYDTLKVNLVTVDTDIASQTIEYSTAPATYFQHRSIEPTTPYETARKLSHAGASLVAITGDNYIVLTSRPNQALYPRTFAVTASGSWDGQMQDPTPQQPPLLVPPTPDNATSHILKELHEEVGLSIDIITSPQSHLTVLGVAEDPNKKHRDVLYSLLLPPDITKETVQEAHQEAKNNNGNGDPTAGHLMFLPANTKMIAKLLTRSQAPWDEMAREGLLMTGYMLKMQSYLDKKVPLEKAVQKATRWKQVTETRMRFNQWNSIDHTAAVARRRKITRSFARLTKATVLGLLGKDTTQQAKVASYDLMKYIARPAKYDVHRAPNKQELPEVKTEARRLGFNGLDVYEPRIRRKVA